MPLYEYKCLRCGASFELLQKVGESSLKKCIKCGGNLEKIISAPALQFKGKGWYVTDYAMKDKPETEEKTSQKKTKDKEDKSSKKEKSPLSSSKD